MVETPEDLDKLREAGRIASAARDAGAARIVAGAGVREVCEAVEDEIRRRGGQPAFPAQSSLNAVAAHHCPPPGDETVYADGDVAKLDVGVHVDGFVVDTALTVNVGDRPENRPLLEAARAALEAAISTAGPGVLIRTLSTAIESTVHRFGLRPIRNLCGHGVGRWTVHCAPAIPNVAEESPLRLSPGLVVAIEPFATDGRGFAVERGEPQVFRVDPARFDARGLDDDLAAALRELRGLPFARRQLARFGAERVEALLAGLRSRRLLMEYGPLVEAGGRPVAQAEHTVWIGEQGVEVLTR